MRELLKGRSLKNYPHCMFVNNKKANLRKFLGLGILIVLCGCAATPPYVYYGDTSHNYYRYVKNRDAKSLEQYKKSLELVFKHSQKKGIKVPPGLYCDYALIMLTLNQNDVAKEYFQKEKVNWNESQPLMDFLLQRYKLKE